MPRVHMGERMSAAVAIFNERTWEAADVRLVPECPEDWGRDHAVLQIEAEPHESAYFDYDALYRDIVEALSAAFGKSFVVIDSNHGPLREGVLYLHFHGNLHGEVEAYRYTKPKRRGCSGRKSASVR